jgi:phytoene synthase
MASPLDLAIGQRRCRRITRDYAKTFFFASHCLPRAVRRHSYAVYGFCRWADNAVDEASDLADATRRLDHVRDVLALAYSDAPAPPGVLAFRETLRDRAIPRPLFDDLLDGMAMDLTEGRYPDYAALDLYCYRVAGVVGLMMTHVFGYRDECCLPHALALGRAMQLTNILRDIREDRDRGRVYLPQDELARFGISEEQLAEQRVDDSFRAFMRFQIDRARRAYAESEQGIPFLIGAASRLTVRVMGRLYGGILDEIERLDYDVFQTRAHVSTPRKLRLLADCQRETMSESWRRSWS